VPRPILSPRHAALGAAIRAAREETGVTIERLADLTGLSQSFVGRLERGVVNVSVERLARVAEALDIGVMDLARSWDDAGSRSS